METAAAARCLPAFYFRRATQANTNHRLRVQGGKICLFVKSEKTPSDIASSRHEAEGSFLRVSGVCRIQLQRELRENYKLCVKISLKTQPNPLSSIVN